MALVMALGIMLVLTIVLTTVITFTAAGARDSKRVNAGQKATALAEAGLSNALAVLNKYYPCDACHPGNPNLLTPARTTTYTTGTAEWSGVLGPAPVGSDWTYEWRLTARGSVPNPTGPTASPVKRTVRAVVPVTIPIRAQIGDNNPLNFIYARDELRFLQSVTVASPVYATNNLYLENSSTISEFIGNDPSSPNRMAVGGVMYGAQNANKIGHVNGTTAANSLEKIYIVGGCNTKAYDNNATTHSCRYGDTLPRDQIWGTITDNFIPADFLDYIPALTCCYPYADVPSLAPAAPVDEYSNMGRLYESAHLGPRSPCKAPGSVPFNFDTPSGVPDDALNNSATPAGSAPINLTPNFDYECTSLQGTLKWDNSAKDLVVDGTIFIDGSVTVNSSPSAQATVSGLGALILTGTFSMKNSLLCVQTVGSGMGTKCDTDPDVWDPDQSSFVVVADGDGGYDSTQAQTNNVGIGEGIVLKSSDFQGGLIANKDINVDTTSRMQGPMISVYHDVHAGQTNVLTFPPLRFAPAGGDNAIGPPPVAQLLPPREFAGG